MKFSDYLIGNQGGQPMSIQVQTPIQPQQMQSIAPQQGMQSSVTDFGIKPNQSAPKKKAETFDVLGMLEKTNQFTQQAIKDNPAPVKREYSGRDKNIIEVKKGIEDSLRETHKLNTLLDMKKYVDDGATFEEVQQDFQDIPQEVIGQIYDELANKSKLSTILKMYPELDNIQPPKELSDKYSLQKDNALKQAGQFILDAKERSKEKGDISSNFLTQGFMGAVGGAVKGVGDLIQGGGGLVDKGIAGTQALIQGGEMEDYQALPNSTAEDLLDTASGVTSSLGALYAMPASILINSGIEALPEEGQRALSDSMDWLGDKIAKIPGLAQWMQSLPPERQSQFKQELAGAGVALLIGLKNKKNIITDPKTFLRENINPVAIAKNFNENVLGIPSNAGKAIRGVSEVVNNSDLVKTAKRGATQVADKGIESLQGISKAEKQGISNNPYNSILKNAINKIDEGQAPADLKDLQSEPLKEVLGDLDKAIDDVKSQKGEGGELFNALREDPTPIDTELMVKEIEGVFEGTDTNINKFLKRVDKDNLLGTKSILAGQSTTKQIHDIRMGVDKLMKKAKISGDFGDLDVLTKIRGILDSKLKENTNREQADAEWVKIQKDIADIEEGITYREARKKGQIRDNIESILLNLTKPAKAKLLSRLEEFVPGIGEKVAMISMIPKVAKAYIDIPTNRLTNALIGGSVGGGIANLPGIIVGAVAGFLGGAGMSVLRKNYLKSAIDNVSDIAKSKMDDIMQRVENGERIKAEDKARVMSYIDKVKEQVAKSKAEQVDKDAIVQALDKSQKKITSAIILKSEGKLETNPIRTSTPKKTRTLGQGATQQTKRPLSSNIKENATNPINSPSGGTLGDNTPTTVKKKPVQSDTLVSKSDSMSKDLQPLYEEARKYKSADEFVNKQDIVYHGTNNEFDNFQLSTNKTKRASSVNSKAVFFADDKNSVKYYGKNIKGAMIDKSNLFDYKNPDHIKELERYLEKYSVQDVQPGALFGKDSLMSFLKKGDYGLIESKLIQSYIKKKGFDGFIANDYGSKDVYGILNLDRIKTESQLRKIREEANRK